MSQAGSQSSQCEAHDAMSCKTLQESISDTTVESQCEEPLQVFRIAAQPVMSRIGGMNPSLCMDGQLERTVRRSHPSTVEH